MHQHQQQHKDGEMFLLFGAVRRVLSHVIYTIRINHLNDLKVQLATMLTTTNY